MLAPQLGYSAVTCPNGQKPFQTYNSKEKVGSRGCLNFDEITGTWVKEGQVEIYTDLLSFKNAKSFDQPVNQGKPISIYTPELPDSLAYIDTILNISKNTKNSKNLAPWPASNFVLIVANYSKGLLERGTESYLIDGKGKRTLFEIRYYKNDKVSGYYYYFRTTPHRSLALSGSFRDGNKTEDWFYFNEMGEFYLGANYDNGKLENSFTANEIFDANLDSTVKKISFFDRWGFKSFLPPRLAEGIRVYARATEVKSYHNGNYFSANRVRLALYDTNYIAKADDFFTLKDNTAYQLNEDQSPLFPLSINNGWAEVSYDFFDGKNYLELGHRKWVHLIAEIVNDRLHIKIDDSLSTVLPTGEVFQEWKGHDFVKFEFTFGQKNRAPVPLSQSIRFSFGG